MQWQEIKAKFPALDKTTLRKLIEKFGGNPDDRDIPDGIIAQIENAIASYQQKQTSPEIPATSETKKLSGAIGNLTIDDLARELGLKPQSMTRLKKICETAIGESLKLDDKNRLLPFDESLLRFAAIEVRSTANPKGKSPEVFISEIRDRQKQASIVESQQQENQLIETLDDAAIAVIQQSQTVLNEANDALLRAIDSGIDQTAEFWSSQLDSEQILKKAFILTAKKLEQKSKPSTSLFNKINAAIFPGNALKPARNISGLLEGTVPIPGP